MSFNIADELAELSYYKERVCGESCGINQHCNSIKSISERLDLLESLGVFALSAFQIDNYKTDNSIRKISVLLSNILGEPSETIRTTIKRKGMRFDKGT